MSIPRFYQNQPLSLGDYILEEDASHHLAHVLRVKLEAKVIVFNGNGLEFEGAVKQISKKNVTIELQQSYCINRESPVALHLVQAVSRRDRMDFSLQKAVELGVTEITPIITDFSNIKHSEEQFHKKEEHWKKITISATQQSGRSILTHLNPILSFRQAIQRISAEQRLFLSPQAKTPYKTLLSEKPKSVALFIGCEGGFSVQEEEEALAAGLNAIVLGPRILRTETATITALSILQYSLGDL